MRGEHHESSERDWSDDSGGSYRTLDELSSEEILTVLAGLDDRL